MNPMLKLPCHCDSSSSAARSCQRVKAGVPVAFAAEPGLPMHVVVGRDPLVLGFESGKRRAGERGRSAFATTNRPTFLMLAM